MKRMNIKNWVSALVGMTFFMAFPACTDDHFDVDEGGDGISSNATLTLWQQIQANPELSKFASIVERTPVFKDETHPIAGYTFKDVLNSNQILTVFAPLNSAFSDADMIDYENLLQTRPYDVYLRLVGNHIALYNYVATGTGLADVILINNKKATFDRAARKFKDMPLTDYNIAATNGTLHTLSAQSPFAYNIYEYLRKNRETYPELDKWLASHDSIRFSPTASAEAGADPVTGEPIYVDSVYYRVNNLYQYSYMPYGQDWEMVHKGFGSAYLESEDSLWAMVLPSNAAYLAMKEKMIPWYKYAPQYYDMTKLDATLKDVDATTKKEYLRDAPDTLWKDAIAMDIISPLVFNVRRQPRTSSHTGVWTEEEFKSAQMAKMFNTRSDTFTIGERISTNESSADVKAFLFGNAEPVKVSNGLIYPVDNWNFYDTYGAMDVEVKVGYNSIYQSGRYNLNSSEQRNTATYAYVNDFKYYSFNNSTSTIAKKHGRVSENYFYYISKDEGESQCSITLKLKDWERDHEIMSGIDYEIGLVLVPNFYRYDPNQYYDPTNGFYNPDDLPIEEYDPDGSILKKYFRSDSIQIDFTYMRENGTEYTTNKAADRFFLCYTGEKVDTVWAHHQNTEENGTIQFPVSYKNLRYAYPTIKITALKNNATKKRGHYSDFGIDRVILRAKKN